jgi:hypothetical protein
MGIRIGNPEIVPELAYDHVHVLNLTIEQPTFTDDSKPPKYTVTILYRLYGIRDGVRYYEVGATRRIKIDDFYQLAVEKAMVGNFVLAQAMETLEQAVSAIIGEQTSFNNLTTT